MNYFLNKVNVTQDSVFQYIFPVVFKSKNLLRENKCLNIKVEYLLLRATKIYLQKKPEIFPFYGSFEYWVISFLSDSKFPLETVNILWEYTKVSSWLRSSIQTH